MDDDGLNGFMRTLHTAFAGGDLNAIEDFMTFPLVFYSSSGVTVVGDPSHLLTLLRGYRDALASNGLVPSGYEIKDRDDSGNGRLRVLVQFFNHLEDKTIMAGSLVRYFLLETNGTFKVEMLEYLSTSLPPSEVARIVH